MTFENGAIAINETGFVSHGCPDLFEIGGDKGYLICAYGVVTYTASDKGPETPELPAPVKSPLECFLTSKPIESCGIDKAIVLTKMMVGAYKK